MTCCSRERLCLCSKRMDTIRLVVLSGYCTTECIIVERDIKLLMTRKNLEQSACGLFRNFIDG